MTSDIWLRTIQIAREETRCRHIGFSFRLTARVLLYASSHIQDNTYHGLCYTSRGALAETRNRSMGPPHEGSIRRPIVLIYGRLHIKYILPLIKKKQQQHIVVSHQRDSSQIIIIIIIIIFKVKMKKKK